MPDRSTAVFTKRLVRSGGSQVRYLEAGHGEPVVVLARGDEPPSLPLSNLLAEHFHVFVFDISHLAPPASNEQSILPRDLARNLAQAADAAGLKRYALVSTSADVAVALWQANRRAATNRRAGSDLARACSFGAERRGE